MSDKTPIKDIKLEAMLKAMSSEMTNGAAIGYMIMAALALGIDRKVIRDMEHMMYEKMDFYGEEHAERVYQSF